MKLGHSHFGSFVLYGLISEDSEHLLLDSHRENAMRARRLLIHECAGSSTSVGARIETVTHFFARFYGDLVETMHRDRAIFLLPNADILLLRDHFLDQLLI